MKRKVYFPKELMGSYYIYPSLFLIFVAKPGVVRKSTSVGFAEDLLRTLNELYPNGTKITFAADVTSDSKLLDAMSNSPDGSITVAASELSSLFKATPEGMYELLTALFDNKRNGFEWATWSHGEKSIPNAVINLFGATTPGWISEQSRSFLSEGGFASRIIFIHETKRRQNKMYYDDVDWSAMGKLEAKLLADLNEINTIAGEFKHQNKSTRDYIEAWYQKHANRRATESNIETFLERKHVHAHKLAMLLSVAERSDRVITKKHWDEAILLLDEVETKLPRALSASSKNPLGPQMDALLDFLEQQNGATREKIAGRFFREIPSLEQLNGILSYLVAAGQIEEGGKPNNPTYSLK